MDSRCSESSIGGQSAGVSNCRARILGLSNLVECNTGVHLCRWHLSFGDGMLCIHPSNAMIARGVLPTGWSLPGQMTVG